MIIKEIFSKFKDNSRTNCTFLEFQEFSRTKVIFKEFSRSVRTQVKEVAFMENFELSENFLPLEFCCRSASTLRLVKDALIPGEWSHDWVSMETTTCSVLNSN